MWWLRFEPRFEGDAISDLVSAATTRTGAETVRFRQIAAILARAAGRVRTASDLSANAEPVSDNLADSQPERLEIADEPPLSVSHGVSDRVGRDMNPNDTEHGEAL